MTSLIREFLVVTTFLVLTTCATSGRGGEILETLGPVETDEVQLCVQNGHTSPLRVRDGSGTRLGTIQPGQRSCVGLEGSALGRDLTGRLYIESIEKSVRLPFTNYRSSATWHVEIGPFPKSWETDVLSLQPARGS